MRNAHKTLILTIIHLVAFVFFLLQTTVAQAGLGGLIDKVMGNTPAPPTLTIYLVDRTGSIPQDDQLLYKNTIGKSVPHLMLGDRVIIADISGLPISQFRTTAETQIPKRTGRRFDDERAINTARGRIQKVASDLVGTPGPGNGTYILDTLSALKPSIESARKAGMPIRIIMLTDGIEESREINFGSCSLNQARSFFNNRKKLGLLPELSGAEVFIVGAGGNDSTRYAIQEKIWRELIEGQGGQLIHYGRTAPDF